MSLVCDELKRGACKQKAFTLVEVIVFLVVMSLAFVGVAQIYHQAVTSSADPIIMLRAKTLARSTLDTVLSHRFDELESFNGLQATEGQYEIITQVVAEGVQFGLPEHAFRRVTVTVYMPGNTSLSLAGYKGVDP